MYRKRGCFKLVWKQELPHETLKKNYPRQCKQSYSTVTCIARKERVKNNHGVLTKAEKIINTLVHYF